VTSVREVTGIDGDMVLSNEVFSPAGSAGTTAAPLRDDTATLLETVGFDRMLLTHRSDSWR